MNNHMSSNGFGALLDLYEDFVTTGFESAGRMRRSLPPAGVLRSIADEIGSCTLCRLSRGRRNTVAGEGSVRPLVLVIGEGPGAAEDASGHPFVGPAGNYLDRWMAAVKLGQEQAPLNRRTNIFITNVVKCRPPDNRDPQPDETQACFPYLLRQVEVLRPRAILTLGRVAFQVVSGTSGGIGAARGRVHTSHMLGDPPLVPTYHPSAVLRNRDLRGSVWEDLKLLKSILGDA